MAKCFPEVFIFLRACPRKGLVTQEPDEGPPNFPVGGHMAQICQLQSRQSPGLTVRKLDFAPHWLGKSRALSGCQLPNNKMW